MYDKGVKYERFEDIRPGFSFEYLEFSLLQLPIRMRVCKADQPASPLSLPMTQLGSWTHI